MWVQKSRLALPKTWFSWKEMPSVSYIIPLACADYARMNQRCSTQNKAIFYVNLLLYFSFWVISYFNVNQMGFQKAINELQENIEELQRQYKLKRLRRMLKLILIGFLIGRNSEKRITELTNRNKFIIERKEKPPCDKHACICILWG